MTMMGNIRGSRRGWDIIREWSFLVEEEKEGGSPLVTSGTSSLAKTHELVLADLLSGAWKQSLNSVLKVPHFPSKGKGLAGLL